MTERDWRSRMRDYPAQPVPSYPLGEVDLAQAADVPEIVPADPELRRTWLTALALDAAVYGLPSVYQYLQMHALAVDGSNPRHVGFNRFRHDRDLAAPGYHAFTTPNGDTLYSHAWLDLSGGPVLIDMPATGKRYYTLHFLDAYSNATNLSTRTAGGSGGRYLVATTDWDGPVDDGVPVFRVATPYMWILLRIFVRDTDDAAAVHALQDAVRITPVQQREVPRPDFVAVPTDPERLDAVLFFRVLDLMLRINGHPVQEDALVYRFRALGLGTDRPLDPDSWDPVTREAVEAGFAAAMRIVPGVRRQRGTAVAGTVGWRTLRSGAYGFNYLYRAATNHVGLGATVHQENTAFTTFVDADSIPLDGGRSAYRLRLSPPPPVDAFWSLSVYDARTREFHPNPVNRHVVNSRTRDVVREPDGGVVVELSREEPQRNAANWLPVPEGPFYLVIRSYLPREEVTSGRWRPNPVERVGSA